MNLTISKVTQWIPKPPFIQWGVLLLLLAVSVEYASNWLKHPPVKPQETVVALVSPKVSEVVKVEEPLQTPTKVLKVYPQSVKKKLSLPKTTADNPKEFVTDSSVVTRTERDTEVNQVVDITTGETTTYVTPLPYPWFRLENKGYAAIDLGYKRNSTGLVGRLNVREDLLQVKGIHLGLTGSVYSDGDYFAGVGGEYRWQ